MQNFFQLVENIHIINVLDDVDDGSALQHNLGESQRMSLRGHDHCWLRSPKIFKACRLTVAGFLFLRAHRQKISGKRKMLKMDKPKRTYSNAGMQKAQAQIEAVRFWNESDDYLVPVKTISIILSIRLQKVIQLPVQRQMIDKRGYYRKGDILAWAELDKRQPDSLLLKLQEEHRKAVDRMYKQPSRRYVSGQEAIQLKAGTREKKLALPDSYEVNLIARKSDARAIEAQDTQRWTMMNWHGGKSAKAARDLLELWSSPKKSK